MLECHLQKGRDHHGFGHHQHPEHVPRGLTCALLTHWPGLRTARPGVPSLADPAEVGQRIGHYVRTSLLDTTAGTSVGEVGGFKDMLEQTGK